MTCGVALVTHAYFKTCVDVDDTSPFVQLISLQCISWFQSEKNCDFSLWKMLKSLDKIEESTK